MKFKNILRLCMVGGFLVLGSAVEASGSLPTAEVVKILNGSGKVGESVTIAFDMEETAVGTRLGRQYGALGGARIGPYFLKAKPKGAAGDSTVMLKIETEVEFLGSDGKSLANGGVGAPEGSVIKERVTGWSVLPISEIEDDIKLTEAAPAKGVEGSKATYAEVMALKLVMEEMAFELDGGPEQGSVKRWQDTAGRVRRVVFSHGGEHSGLSHDVYYDVAGNPRFFMSTLSSWGFVPGKPNVTRDTIRERRFYMNEAGLTLQVLEKFYEGEGEGEIKAAQGKAKNIELNPDAYATRKFVVYGREMRDAKKPKFMALAGELLAANEDLLEPAPSIEEHHWRVVEKLPVMSLPASDRIEDRVMGELMRVGLIAEANTNQEGDYQVIPEVVGTEAGANGQMKVWVIVTATGLADDAIEGERFLARLEGATTGPFVLKYLGKQVKNWKGRGVEGWRK